MRTSSFRRNIRGGAALGDGRPGFGLADRGVDRVTCSSDGGNTVLLDFPAPHLRACARETVIAEKFQAMVLLGRANNRMKDLYDIWVLSKSLEFKSDALARAIAVTLARRKTEIPASVPDALNTAFAEDPAKVAQWNSFVEDVSFKPGSLGDVIETLDAFLLPRAIAARDIPTDER